MLKITNRKSGEIIKPQDVRLTDKAVYEILGSVVSELSSKKDGKTGKKHKKSSSK